MGSQYVLCCMGDSSNYNNGCLLKAIGGLVEQERRRSDDKRWDNIDEFIKEQREFNGEGREFRAGLKVTLDNQDKKLEEIDGKIKTQNGRIGKLEISDAMNKGAIGLIIVGMPVVIFLLNKLFK